MSSARVIAYLLCFVVFTVLFLTAVQGLNTFFDMALRDAVTEYSRNIIESLRALTMTIMGLLFAVSCTILLLWIAVHALT